MVPNTLVAGTMMVLGNKVIATQDDFEDIREKYLHLFHEYHLLSVELEQYIFLENKTPEQVKIIDF